MGIQIDGIHIIVSDVYAKMKKKEAVECMIDEGFVPGETLSAKKAWAEKAYDLINPKKQSPAAAEAGASLNDDRPDHSEHGTAGLSGSDSGLGE